eukprot:Clim_evm9s175 gene=Clim_evmTU9s175
MAKKRKAGQGQQVDFKKTKVKVGKAKAKAANATNTDITSKAIRGPQQHALSSKDGVPLNSQRKSLEELISLTKHQKGSVRKGAVDGIDELIQLHPDVLSQQLGSLLSVLFGLINDPIEDVRHAVNSTLVQIANQTDASQMKPFSDLGLMQTKAAMNNVNEGVRLDSLGILDIWLDYYPQLLAERCEELLPSIISLFSTQSRPSGATGSSGGNLTLQTDPNALGASSRGRLEVLSRLKSLMQSIYGAANGLDEETANYTNLTLAPGSTPRNATGSSTNMRNTTQGAGSGAVLDIERSISGAEYPAVDPLLLALNRSRKGNVVKGDLRSSFEQVIPLLMQLLVELPVSELSNGKFEALSTLSATLDCFMILMDSRVTDIEEMETNFRIEYLKKNRGFFETLRKLFMTCFPVPGDNIKAMGSNLKLARALSYFGEGFEIKNAVKVENIMERLQETFLTSVKNDDNQMVGDTLTCIWRYMNKHEIGDDVANPVRQNVQNSLKTLGHKSPCLRTVLTFLAVDSPVTNDWQWANQLPRILWQLSDRNPQQTELILTLLTNMAKRDGASTQIFQELQSQLVPFFYTTVHIQNETEGETLEPAFGPFIKLPLRLQRASLEMLYWLDQVSPKMLMGLAYCCCADTVKKESTSYIDAYVATYLLDILHTKLGQSQPSNMEAAVGYVSFLITVLLGETSLQLQVETITPDHSLYDFPAPEMTWIAHVEVGRDSDSFWNNRDVITEAICEKLKSISWLDNTLDILSDRILSVMRRKQLSAKVAFAIMRCISRSRPKEEVPDTIASNLAPVVLGCLFVVEQAKKSNNQLTAPARFLEEACIEALLRVPSLPGRIIAAVISHAEDPQKAQSITPVLNALILLLNAPELQEVFQRHTHLFTRLTNFLARRKAQDAIAQVSGDDSFERYQAAINRTLNYMINGRQAAPGPF